jgi:hypothetical protein
LRKNSIQDRILPQEHFPRNGESAQICRRREAQAKGAFAGAKLRGKRADKPQAKRRTAAPPPAEKDYPPKAAFGREDRMPKFLHAMCGLATRQRTTLFFAGSDWEEVRLDPSPEAAPDIQDGFPDMRAVEDASCDAVFTGHSLERLYPHEAMTALGNCLRVLKEDGYIVVICADIQQACAMIAQDDPLGTAYHSPAGAVTPLDILYGFRPALAAGRREYACHCGFTAKILMNSLIRSGFGTVWSSRNRQAFSMAAIATRQKRSEAFLAELAGQHFG